MSQDDQRVEQRIELLLRHIQELRELATKTREARHALSQRHREQRDLYSADTEKNARSWAGLLAKQAEELTLLAAKNTSLRVAVLTRQQQELDDFDNKINP